MSSTILPLHHSEVRRCPWFGFPLEEPAWRGLFIRIRRTEKKKKYDCHKFKDGNGETENLFTPRNWIRPALRNVGHRCNLIIQRHKIHLYLFVFPQGLGLKESPERYICRTPASYHRGGREREREVAGLPVTLLPTFNEHVAQQWGQVGDVREAMYE